jgi:hypothetical protein
MSIDLPPPDLAYFKSTLESIKALSPEAHVFALVHKMDLVHDNLRADVFEMYRQQIEETCQVRGGEIMILGEGSVHDWIKSNMLNKNTEY